MKITTPRLYALVRQAAEQNRTAEQLAKIVGISLSAMLRGAKTGSLSTDTLLAIAEAGGLDPSELLRVAGKDDTARRIVRLYGKPLAPLTANDRALAALEPDVKAQLLRLVSLIEQD